jgi:hypothetical protein
VIALDQRGACPSAAPACGTRISYGDTWLRAPNHAADYDDVAGRVTWDGICRSNATAVLSNGWTPTFTSANACELSLRYTQCGGLYANPVVEVQTVEVDAAAQVRPVVMETEKGDAVIWMVDEKKDEAKKKQSPTRTEELELDHAPDASKKAGEL